MAGHGSTAGLMAYGDANAVAMGIGTFEVLPVVEDIPVMCGVHATDPLGRAAGRMTFQAPAVTATNARPAPQLLAIKSSAVFGGIYAWSCRYSSRQKLAELAS